MERKIVTWKNRSILLMTAALLGLVAAVLVNA